MKSLKHLHKQYDQKLTTENQFSKKSDFRQKKMIATGMLHYQLAI